MCSNETGRPQVYVVPFPRADAKWQISTNGGTEPRWAHSGRELFYRNGTNEMVVAEIVPGTTFATGAQRVLFPWGGLDDDRWAVAPGDQRFVFVRTREGTGAELIVVENFFEELRAKARNE